MRAHYDLSKSPATHDFVTWLARCELKRREAYSDHLEINIMPGTRDQSIRDKTLPAEQRAWTARTLLPQLAWLLPSVKNVTFHHLGIQHEPYTPLQKWPGNLFRASDHAREVVKEYLSDKPNPVSITPRQSSFQPERNANRIEWLGVISWLWSNGYSPIIVPDTETIYSQSARNVWPHDTYWGASTSSDIRLALYEQCEMNLMTNGGPMVLALMADVPLMAFKLIVPGIATCSPQYMAANGFANGAEYAPGKKLFWADDRKEHVIAQLTAWHEAKKAKAA